MRSDDQTPLLGARRGRFVRSVLFSAALLLGVTAPHSGHAQPLTIEGSAQVPVQDDLARARARALSEAMSQALEQAVAQAAPEARGRLYLLTARARDYVPTYRVISEGEEAGSFRVRIEAQVDMPRLLRDLQGAAPQKRSAGRKPLQLCTRVQGAEAQPELQEALRQGAELLGEHGDSVETVAPASCLAPGIGLQGRGRLVLQPGPIQGPVQAEEIRGTQPRLFGARRSIEWQLERPGEPEPLRESAEATAFAESAAEAQLAATRQAAQQALRRLSQRPGLLDGSAAGIRVTFEGLGSTAAYQQVLRALGALPGVTRVEPRRFTAAQSPGEERVGILLHTTAGAEALGAALGRTQLPGLRLQVMPLPGGDLRVLVVPDGALPVEAPPAAAEPSELPAAPEKGAP